jgi:hypothetical protein
MVELEISGGSRIRFSVLSLAVFGLGRLEVLGSAGV